MRLSYSKNANGSAEVLEENNFYPFGLKHEGYNVQAGNPAYNYQYNGKELQKETGWSDYGARMYMSDIARWGVIDPLAEVSRRFTPYNYAVNNPITFTDPDGRKPQSWDDEQANIMYKVAPEGSLWWVFASGDHIGAGMQGGGDGIGDFFGQMNVRSGGGGGASAEDNINSFIRNGVSYETAVKVSNNGAMSFNEYIKSSGPGPNFDLLSLVLSIAGVNPQAPANMMSLGIISSLFAPKDAWIAVANNDTMDEWSQKYIKFKVASDGLFIDPANPKERIKGITNPNTGKIILAPGLFNGKRTNYGLGDVIIHENNHYENWKAGILQGNHPLIQDLNEISAYKAAGEWTGTIDSGVKDYYLSIGNYIINNIINPKK